MSTNRREGNEASMKLLTDRAGEAKTAPDGEAAALERATAEIAERLRRRGVWLSGRESSEQLVTLLEAVERFEVVAERRGADLMVDEPLPDASPTPVEPDNRRFTLPLRRAGEPVAQYMERIVEAVARAAEVDPGTT
jgi:hypothetical protein